MTHTQFDTAALEATARNLAAAQEELAKANQVLSTAGEHARRIDARIQELESKRAEIISRRHRGEHRPDDGATLELTAADLSGLRDLQMEAEQAYMRAKGTVELCQKTVDGAACTFQVNENTINHGALVSHAGALASLLSDTLNQLRDLEKRMDQRRPAWLPPEPLMLELRRIWVAHGRM